MAVQIQLRRDTAADWTSANPVLAAGEMGFETDTLRYKLGDGATAWNSLTYGVFDGLTTGRRYAFDDTITDSDPGAGLVRFNHATFASITSLFFDNVDGAGGTVTAWLDMLDDASDPDFKGTLFIQKLDDADVYREFVVDGAVTDGTGYRKVPVSPLTENGTLSDGDQLVVTFYRAGSASVDTARLLPAGGTTGQVLAKVDGDDYDVEWADQEGGSALGSRWGITASVASNALTVALKAPDGNDPSAGLPVELDFRSATANSGIPSTLTIDSALSLTISSGSTMGATSGVAFRLWLVAFNDGGTERLGLINCRNGSSIFALRESRLLSSTAEGGAGGADSAHVLYTGTAVTTKAFRILGYLEWSTGLATAGTWSAGPDIIQIFERGVSLPGEVVQMVVGTDSASTNNTTTSYTDTTTTASITPTSAANLIGASWYGNMMMSVNNTECYAQLHRAGTPIGQVATIYSNAGGVTIWPVFSQTMDFPGSTGSSAYTVRIKSGVGGNQTRWNYGPSVAAVQLVELQG